eukprot:m.332767 g.332767  ORF g.332767 m.332767 type:complete len:188 (-) comp20494_c0_seq16:1170-1733(-)
MGFLQFGLCLQQYCCSRNCLFHTKNARKCHVVPHCINESVQCCCYWWNAQGTLVRVFDTATGKQQCELRRGSNDAAITCINFSPNSEFLCVSSDKATVHIFSLMAGDVDKGGFMPKYFNSTWSFAKFTVESPGSVCTFSDDSKSVLAICHDGTFYRCRFGSKGETEMTIQNYLTLPSTSPGHASAAD